MALEKAVNHLKKYQLDENVIILDQSSATVALAALALGTQEQRIAKTLSFRLNDNSVILIVMAGDAKVDNRKYRDYFSCKAKMLSFEEVEREVGHGVGGVCPFGINEGVKVYLDESLKRFDVVYPAAGESNTAVKLTISQLEKASEYVSWLDISKIV